MTKSRYQELKEQYESIQRELEAERDKVRTTAIQECKERIAEFEISPAELGFASAGTASTKTKRTSKVRYRGPAGESWSGMGRKPAWVEKALADGKTLEDLAVNS